MCVTTNTTSQVGERNPDRRLFLPPPPHKMRLGITPRMGQGGNLKGILARSRLGGWYWARVIGRVVAALLPGIVTGGWELVKGFCWLVV